MRWAKCERGSVTTEYLIVAIFMLFFVVIGPDLILLGGTYYAVSDAAAKGLDQAALMGQVTPEIYNSIRNRLGAVGLDPDRWTVTYSQGTASYGQPLEVTITGTYYFKAFRLFGLNLGVPVSVRKTGVSQVYVRV